MKRELSEIEKLEAVKKAMEALGFDFGTMTIRARKQIIRKIQIAIEVANKDLEVLK